MLMQNGKSDYIMIDKMGFSYYQVNATKTQIHWRCCHFKNWKRKCHARVLTENSRIVKKYGLHSHSGIVVILITRSINIYIINSANKLI